MGMKSCNVARRAKFLWVFLLLQILFLIAAGTSAEAAAKYRLNKKRATVAVGSTVRLSVKQDAAKRKKVRWSSSNKKVASVNSKGLIRAKKSGTARIYAKIGKKKLVCKIRVINRPALSRKQVQIRANKSVVIKVTGTSSKPRWSSSNKKIAAVYPAGKNCRIRGVKSGVCTVRAKVNGKILSCVVTVRKKKGSSNNGSGGQKISVSLDQSSLQLVTGDSAKLVCTISSKNAGTDTDCTWTSSNSSVASVERSGHTRGKITANQAGECDITVEAAGHSAVCHVTVVSPATSSTFYSWIVEKFSGNPDKQWAVADAQAALNMLAHSKHISYTHTGNVNDATSIRNMNRVMHLYSTWASLRASDPNFPGNCPLYLTAQAEAAAQVHANISSNTRGHEDQEQDLGPYYLECLAWGYGTSGNGPFDGWYDEEKPNYERYVSYMLNTYGFDVRQPHTIDEANAVYKKAFQDPGYTSIGETGHYTTTVLRGSQVWDAVKGTVYERPFKAVIGGLAYGYGCDALETDGLDELTNTYYTVEQYQALFSEFLASHPEIRGQLDS